MSTAVTKPKEADITDVILRKVSSLQQAGMLHLPPDYSAANAIKAAQLILQEKTDKNGQPVLSTCTRTSVGRSLLKMVLDGMNPLMGHGNFIPHGTTLTWRPEYTGNLMVAKRDCGLAKSVERCVYEGDEFTYDIVDGVITNLNHKQNPNDIDPDKIKFAYCVLTFHDGNKHIEVMNMRQIRTSWAQGGNETPAHKKFPDQMAEKTVLNRALKVFIKSRTDKMNTVGDIDEEEELVPVGAMAIADADIVDFDDDNTTQQKSNQAPAKPEPIMPEPQEEPAPTGEDLFAKPVGNRRNETPF
jgi:recombination protein RecT